MLCKLVSRLEMRTIENVDERAIHVTSRRRNVEKALAILRQHPNMRPRYLDATEDVLLADPAITIGLINDIQHAYRKPVTKKATPDLDASLSDVSEKSSKKSIEEITVAAPVRFYLQLCNNN